jgi:hypothetical protein
MAIYLASMLDTGNQGEDTAVYLYIHNTFKGTFEKKHARSIFRRLLN